MFKVGDTVRGKYTGVDYIVAEVKGDDPQFVRVRIKGSIEPPSAFADTNIYKLVEEAKPMFKVDWSKPIQVSFQNGRKVTGRLICSDRASNPYTHIILIMESHEFETPRYFTKAGICSDPNCTIENVPEERWMVEYEVNGNWYTAAFYDSLQECKAHTKIINGKYQARKLGEPVSLP